MKIGLLLVKEIRHRKLSFFMGVLSVVLATAAVTAPYVLLQRYDRHTESLLQAKEEALKSRVGALNDQIRRTMLKLGFNLVILPKGQDLAEWYSRGEGHQTMPEEYAAKLAQSDIMVVQHLLPSLQVHVLWPEQKRKIILVGARGEEPRTNVKLRQLQDPVARGTIVLGYELQQSLGLKVGDHVKLMGREFVVANCYGERGNRDDVTVWLNLHDAQELLDKPGRINAIMALQCNCPDSDLASIRRQVAQILPDTQVIERRSKALARAEARAEIKKRGRRELAEARRSREQLRSERSLMVSVLVPIVLVACAFWIGMTAFGNVRERRGEIGILRAMGVGSSSIMVLFLGRALLMGFVGGVPGYFVGIALGGRLGTVLEGGASSPAAFDWRLFAVAVVSACMLSLLAGWLPASLAARQDPARILHS